MKWVNKLSVFMMVLALLFGSMVPSVMAYEGGFLDSQAVNKGTAINAISSTTLKLSDGTTSTSEVIAASGGTDTFWYEFTSLKSIGSYRFWGSANTHLNIKVRFYDGAGTLIFDQFPGSITGNEVVLTTPVDNVKKVSFENISVGTAFTIYDFDVFGSTIIDSTPPGEITGLSEIHTDDSVDFTFTLPSDMDFSKVEVYRNNTLISGNVTTGSFSQSSLIPDTLYEYKFVTVDTTGNKSTGVILQVQTEAEPTAPSTPVGLVATPGDGSVSLSWNTVSGAIGYKLYRDGALIATQAGISYSDAGLLNGVTYNYQVAAYNAVGDSAKSTGVNATPESSAVPLSNLVLRPGVDRIAVSWSGGEAPFTIDYGGTLITTNNNDYIISGLLQETAYAITVTDNTGAMVSGSMSTSNTALLEPAMSSSEDIVQKMVDSFGTAGTYALFIIGGAVSLGIIVIIGFYCWRLLKRWLSSAK